MNRNSIIVQLWDSKELIDAISKMQPEELQEDLRSELFKVLCEMDEDKLIDMHKRNVLKFYLVRTMINMMQSNTSQFYRTYRKPLNAEVELHDRDEELLNRVEDELSKLHWFSSDLLRLYAINHNCNAKELSRVTGIPYMTIHRVLKLTKRELKKQLRK
jgi:hypothetical protein